MKIALVFLAALSLFANTAPAYAGCHTYMVNGRLVTCCTTGTFTNCF